MKKSTGLIICGFCAGAVNGLFGAGGGMVLVPLLTLLTQLKDNEIFPYSVSIILPICIVSLAFSLPIISFPWDDTACYLAGSILGGIAAGIFSSKIPTLWLHRVLGIFILWGGIRYLC